MTGQAHHHQPSPQPPTPHPRHRLAAIGTRDGPCATKTLPHTDADITVTDHTTSTGMSRPRSPVRPRSVAATSVPAVPRSFPWSPTLRSCRTLPGPRSHQPRGAPSLPAPGRHTGTSPAAAQQFCLEPSTPCDEAQPPPQCSPHPPADPGTVHPPLQPARPRSPADARLPEGPLRPRLHSEDLFGNLEEWASTDQLLATSPPSASPRERSTAHRKVSCHPSCWQTRASCIETPAAR